MLALETARNKEYLSHWWPSRGKAISAGLGGFKRERPRGAKRLRRLPGKLYAKEVRG